MPTHFINLGRTDHKLWLLPHILLYLPLLGMKGWLKYFYWIPQGLKHLFRYKFTPYYPNFGHLYQGDLRGQLICFSMLSHQLCLNFQLVTNLLKVSMSFRLIPLYYLARPSVRSLTPSSMLPSVIRYERSVARSLARSFACPYNMTVHPRAHSRVCSFVHPPIHSSIQYFLFRLFMHSFIHSLIHSCIICPLLYFVCPSVT